MLKSFCQKILGSNLPYENWTCFITFTNFGIFINKKKQHFSMDCVTLTCDAGSYMICERGRRFAIEDCNSVFGGKLVRPPRPPSPKLAKC